jgi:hypothetical protein
MGKAKNTQSRFGTMPGFMLFNAKLRAWFVLLTPRFDRSTTWGQQGFRHPLLVCPYLRILVI